MFLKKKKKQKSTGFDTTLSKLFHPLAAEPSVKWEFKNCLTKIRDASNGKYVKCFLQYQFITDITFLSIFNRKESRIGLKAVSKYLLKK